MRLSLAEPLHLVGIGGVGMRALAVVLASRGTPITGSDREDGPAIAALRARGIPVTIGHDARSVEGAGTVVTSSAIRATNPEVLAACARGIPVIHRAQLLALVAGPGPTIAVTGTAGKTTTSAMIVTIARDAHLDPTFLIGSDLLDIGANAAAGGPLTVLEADESDGSFLWLVPDVAVVTNIQPDHLDHYRDLDEIAETIRAFLAQTRGTIVACADDPLLRSIVETGQLHARVETYGAQHGRWRLDDRHGDVSIQRDEVRIGALSLPMPGRHNLLNALAAVVAAAAVGVAPAEALGALARFGGTRRRFENRGSVRGIRVIDDYAHHPNKVEAVLQAARERANRILVVFQPHLFSRTRDQGAALGAALAGGADAVAILPVYGSREDPISGVDASLVVDGARHAHAGADVTLLAGADAVAGWVRARAQSGDIILTLGAGDVTDLAEGIVRALQEGT